MLKVGLTSARAGMTLAMAVHHPGLGGGGGHVLLRPGFRLDQTAIDRLKELKVGVVWVKYPPTEFLTRYVSPTIIEHQRQLTERLGEVFDAVSGNAFAQLEYRAYSGAVRGLLERLLDDRAAAVFVQDIVDAEKPLLAHSGSVAFLSLVMGLKLEEYIMSQRKGLSGTHAKNIEPLGVGAMLHDVGKLKFSSGTWERWKETGDESFPQWRAHVTDGFELVRGTVEPTAAGVVLHHHQRFDGSGYPWAAEGSASGGTAGERGAGGGGGGLEGERAHVFARIAAVADAFDRLRRPDHPMMSAELGAGADGTVPVVRVLKVLKGRADRRQIDPVVFRALLSVAPAFSPGSLVKLSDGRTCVVTGWDAEMACRPRVRPMERMEPEDAKESDLGAEINLCARPDLRVTEAEGQDVSRDVF